MRVPEEYGGSEAGDYRFNAVLLEELAKVNLALASSMSIHFDVVAPYLVKLSTPDQRERWLPGFCDGSIVTAIAMTEPSAGSDLGALRTSAVEDPNGGWILNGSKIFITNGGSGSAARVAFGAHIPRLAVDRRPRAVIAPFSSKLCGQYDVGAAVGDRLTDELLISEGAIHVGGVQKGAALVEEGVDGGNVFAFVPFAGEIFHAHTAEAEGGNSQ